MRNRKIACRYCNQTETVKKHGRGHAGYQRFRCIACKKCFQLEYAYTAWQPGIKEQIVEMTQTHNSGLRETGRALNIAYNTVLNTLKRTNQSDD